MVVQSLPSSISEVDTSVLTVSTLIVIDVNGSVYPIAKKSSTSASACHRVR